MLSANGEKIKCTSYGVDFMFKLSNLFDQIASMCRLAALDLTKDIALKEETSKLYREKYRRTQDEEEVQNYRKYIKRDNSRRQQIMCRKQVIEHKSVQSSEDQQQQHYPKRSFYKARNQVQRESKRKNQRRRRTSITQQKQPGGRTSPVKALRKTPTQVIYARRTSPIENQYKEARNKVQKQPSKKIRSKKQKFEKKPSIKNLRQLKKLGITLPNLVDQEKKSEQSSEYSEIKKLDSEVLQEQQKIIQEKHVQTQRRSEQKVEQQISQEEKFDEKPKPKPQSKTQFKSASILLRGQQKQESKPQAQQSSPTLQLIQMKPHQIFSRNSSRSAPVGISRKVPLHGNMKLMVSSEESSEPSDYKSRSKTKKQSGLKKSSKSARRSRKAKKPEGQVKRPTNSFMMFLKEVKQRLRKDYNVFKAKELSQAASKQWKLLTPQQKQHYKIMAANAHKRKLQQAILQKVLLTQNTGKQQDPAVIVNRSISIDSKEQKPKTTVNKKPRSESEHDESNTAKEEEDDESSSSSSSDEEEDDQSMSNSNDQDNANSNSESSSSQKDQTISQQESKRKSKKDVDMKKEDKKTVETKH